MYVDDLTRLKHMRDSAQEALGFIQGRSRADLGTDRMLALALVQCLTIIGEAASKVTRERQQELSGIPWADIIGIRHRLIHGYVDVNLDIVWAVVVQRLPPLLDELGEAIPRLEAESEGR